MGRPRLYDYNVGDVVGDLECVDIEKCKPRSGKCIRYVMKCKTCGRVKKMRGPELYSGAGITHKACGKGLKTKDKTFHSIWCGLRTRTTNPKYEHWSCYGGRGISSEAFRYFIDFYDTMYESYKKAVKKYGKHNVSIERIDVDGDYEPENCCWIPLKEQKGNMRKTVYFEAIDPDGYVTIGRNLLKYAKTHGLSERHVYSVLSGERKSTGGYRIRRIRMLQRQRVT